MKKVKPQECKTSKINDIIGRDLKKIMSNRIKILRIPLNYTKFYKVKIVAPVQIINFEKNDISDLLPITYPTGRAIQFWI